MEMPPLRTLNDFLLGNARFQVPDFIDENRWLNRIIGNLIYYQSNYFFSSLVIFILATFFHPQEMAYGIGVMVTLFGVAFYARTQKPKLQHFKNNHPFFYLFALLSLSYFIIYKMGCVVVFLLGIMLPVAFILIHASFRLDNVKNKVISASEIFGVARKSPMAYFLSELGIEPNFKYIK